MPHVKINQKESSTSSLPGSTAVIWKRSQYDVIMLTHLFVSVAVETLGPVSAKGLRFLDKIDDRLTAISHESCPFSNIFVTLLIQCFNMIAFCGSISEMDIEV